MTGPLKIILALVIVALCASAFYLLDWQSRFAQLDQETRNLADARAALDKAREDLKQLPVLTRQMEAKEAELQALVSSSSRESPDLFVAHYLAEIERLVAGQREETGDATFSIHSITPGEAPKVEGEAPAGMGSKVFQMQMTGHYSTLVDFLYQLGALKLDRLVTINKLSLSPASDGSLSISIPVTAYLRSGG